LKNRRKKIDEATERFSERQYENWVIFRFGCELGDRGDIDLIFRAPNEYPDAQLIKVRNGEILWELDVEFEKYSSNFKGHDPEGCDLIVCAHHDWKEKFPTEKCPLPVYVIGGKYFPKEED